MCMNCRNLGHQDLALMFGNSLPQFRILLHPDLLARVEFVMTPKFDGFLEERNYICVEGFPVWVFEVVSLIFVSR